MDFKNFAMNAVTLGGYEQLEIAKAAYASAYRDYEDNRHRLQWLERARTEKLSVLGQLVIKGFKAAKASRKILRHVGRRHSFSPVILDMNRAEFGKTTSLANVDRIIADYSSSVSVATGAGAGAAMAAGSWSLVALIGSASTGTAISTLSGVAATNATLAWFGGGALAAGGAGMAGGTLVLGGVALAPVVAVAAWQARSKTKEIKQETEKVREADVKVRQAINPTQGAIDAISRCIEGIGPPAEALEMKLRTTTELIYPVWGWSMLTRCFSKVMGKSYFSEEEHGELRLLEAHLTEFISRFQTIQGANI